MDWQTGRDVLTLVLLAIIAYNTRRKIKGLVLSNVKATNIAKTKDKK